MRYQSTRDKSISITSAEAIARGLSRDGGLFVPESVPTFKSSDIETLCGMDYRQRAVYIMRMYLDDYSAEELGSFTAKAYSAESFDAPEIAPVRKLKDGLFTLELWHGPTCAFKDMALQMLPYYLTAALKKTGEEKKVCILVATSGDTGKAALEGFKDVDGTKIMVFYPRDGVSEVQKLQMTSQEGNNVSVCSVKGNFDDAQAGVKKIFSDVYFREKLDSRGWFLSSANSINWGRLLPQVVYYVSAYCDLINSGDIKNGDKINFCVPTGNFGDILAGWYASRMGLPVGKFICASNMNDVLTEFINTGVYNKNRPFHTTVSPSMDILVSSNLERLLYELSGHDDALVSGYMGELASSGVYTVTDAIKNAVTADFAAGLCSDDDTRTVIGKVFGEFGYLMDTHTAVGYKVLDDYRTASGDMTPAVVVSTASPYKFCGAVLEALGEIGGEGGVELIDRLEKASGTNAPMPLKALKDKKPRFEDCAEKDEMISFVDRFLS